jgi:hypothetical protein
VIQTWVTFNERCWVNFDKRRRTVATNHAFELGAGTIRGEVTALQSTFLHDRAKVDGTLLVPAMSTITYQNRQTISVGEIDLIPGADTWTIRSESVV